MARNNLLLGLLVVFILLIGTNSILFLVLKGNDLTGFVVADQVALPAGAVKLSECIPNMGIHYANPADMPFGPIYLMDKGKVIGIEYMIHEDELEENIMQIGEEKIGKTVVMPALGKTYDHIELNYMIEGHEGDTEPHYDIHMYLISVEEQKQLC